MQERAFRFELPELGGSCVSPPRHLPQSQRHGLLRLHTIQVGVAVACPGWLSTAKDWVVMRDESEHATARGRVSCNGMQPRRTHWTHMRRVRASVVRIFTPCVRVARCARHISDTYVGLLARNREGEGDFENERSGRSHILFLADFFQSK